MDLCNIQDLKELLGRHGFRFSKSMGQNFLIEGWVPRDIAESSGADQAHGVLEIGPGVGTLTRELCKRAGRVTAVELDHDLYPLLAETMADFENFTLVPGDILRLNIPQLVEEHFGGLTPLVCANLPYNITTPVLTALVEAHKFAAITVMIQKEVALRIAAAPGSKDYGAFSLYMQYHTEPELLFDVPPTCFIPAPKVTSAVLHCKVRETPPVSPVCGEDFLFRTVRGGFAQRRKTLVNSLSSVFSEFSKPDIAEAIAACGLPESVRGERLGLEEYAALADALYHKLN